MKEKDALLSVKNLKTYFFTRAGTVKAVDNVSFNVFDGSSVGIVGESGCGKSMTALSIMRLVPEPAGRIVQGKILFRGRDLTSLKENEMQKIRGRKISMIFQEPMTALNPVFRIGHQIADMISLHKDLNKKDAVEDAIRVLDLVGMPSPNIRIRDYPHQLSGGMRQRAMIAMALSCNPDLMIADEPTTALDVTIQAQILALMQDIRKETGTANILITHDLGVIAENTEEVIVMYAGKVVEQAECKTLFENPLHPYTRGLMACIPKLGSKKKYLSAIEGMVPNLYNLPAGCSFESRCTMSHDLCRKISPKIYMPEPRHFVRCLLYSDKIGVEV